MYKLLLLSMMLFLGFADAFAAEIGKSNAGRDVDVDEVGVSNSEPAQEALDLQRQEAMEALKGPINDYRQAITRSFDVGGIDIVESAYVALFFSISRGFVRERLRSAAKKTGHSGAFEAAEQLAWQQSAVDVGMPIRIEKVDLEQREQ